MNAKISDLVTYKDKVKIKVVHLTPNLARLMLSSIEDRDDIEIGQRILNQRVVNSYVAQIERGEWTMNGAPIIISDRGYLMDGQHRCHAVIRANHAIDVVVVEGVDESAMDTIDQNRVRSKADVLNMAGVNRPLSLVLAAQVTMELRMQRGEHIFSGGVEAQITPHEVLEAVKDDETLTASAEWVTSFRGKPTGYAASHLAFLHRRFMLIDPAFSEGWLDDFITGANLGEHDPRLWIRTKIAREANTKAKTRVMYRFIWIVKAWDRARKNKIPKVEYAFFSSINTTMELRHIAMEGDMPRTSSATTAA